MVSEEGHSAFGWMPATAAQKAALDSKADILFFGGSAGSLKTETMLMDAVQEFENPNLRAIIFRSSFVEMTDLIDKTRRLYAPLGGVFVGSPKWTWTFPSGASIRFAYMKTDDDVWKYLGPRYSFIGFDESTLHTEKQVRNILGRLSSTDSTLSLRMRLTSNPGNVGAPWHQALFLRGHCPVHTANESAQPGQLYLDGHWPSDGQPIPFSLAFIPGKLSDHTLLDKNYAKRLHMMAGGAAAAMEQGCWCSLEGTYFPFIHAGMMQPLAEVAPQWWYNHFLSIDYGYGKSSTSVGLYVRGPAELPSSTSIPGLLSNPLNDQSGPDFPQGRIWKLGELVVPHVPAYELAQMVVERFIKPPEGGQRLRIIAAYLDPANFKDIGDGHTIADQINEIFEPWDITCERASNDRLGGWQLLYRVLRTGEFVICDTCPKTFEALRTRIHDDTRVGDIRKVAGDPLDDVADETRYALYTFIQQAAPPRELILQQAVKGLDLGSATIRWQQKAEELDLEKSFIPTTLRLGWKQKRR
jgi:Terminase large subunit, T4likevirus-type, N-terminal